MRSKHRRGATQVNLRCRPPPRVHPRAHARQTTAGRARARLPGQRPWRPGQRMAANGSAGKAGAAQHAPRAPDDTPGPSHTLAHQHGQTPCRTHERPSTTSRPQWTRKWLRSGVGSGGWSGLGAQVGQGLTPGPAAAVGQGVVGHDSFDSDSRFRGVRGHCRPPSLAGTSRGWRTTHLPVARLRP